MTYAAEQKSTMPLGSKSLLEVSNLTTRFFTRDGVVHAVDNLSFEVAAGETLAIVGESGCGKSMTSLSIMGLVPKMRGTKIDGSIYFSGQDLFTAGDKRMREIRGNEISMIFQEPMTSLNPLLSIGWQICEPLILHEGLERSSALKRSEELLSLVGISDPKRALRSYPHQLSGGMRQRVMIAIALACSPKLLIADEPTTALDVTIQAQIIDLMKRLQRETGSAIIFITHDLGVVAEVADRVLVMYTGRKIEEASVIDIFEKPSHPYTQGLIGSIPRPDQVRLEDTRLSEIPGNVPSLSEIPPGCSFSTRCPIADEKCFQKKPLWSEIGDAHRAYCHYAGSEKARRVF